ncbi:MAG: sugar ABC transporter ATP-binding protein [Clostridiales bacterium]|nr:sugar ABC transporter ATP-binding protein [Clostridiales bacterium]
MPDVQYHVDMENICKAFGGVKACQGVNLHVRAGEIHALVGENGAGKSTLMKILSGAYFKASGDICINGQKVNISNPKDGLDRGISVIYQEFALINSLTVAENIFIDKLSEKGRLINWKKLREKARNVLESLGFGDIPANKVVSELTVAHQQVVEICKALARESSVLILDEPTSVLASSEVEQLFKLLRDLKSKGVAIIYISHRLEEIFRLCDRISVMKDGCYIGTYETSELDDKKLVSLMIGRTLESYFPAREPRIGKPVFKVENINAGRAVKNVSFEVREGEVLGISGLVGAGRTETLRAIFGADPMDGGRIYLNGKQIKIKTPICAVKQGIGMLPEDRKAHGVLLKMPIRTNITLTRLKSFTGLFNVINRKRDAEYVGDIAKQLSIKAASIDSSVSSLSGGNQQKVAIAKLLASDCRVLILDEPTRGVDVGAKIEIYKIINSLVAQNYAVIMISSEMMEVIGMCDRAVVMKGGGIAGELSRDELTEQNLINYSMGVI